MSVKNGFTNIIFHNYAKIKVDSNDSLPLKKIMTFYNVKPVSNTDKHSYYYNML